MKYVSDFEQPSALPLAVLVNKGTSAGAEFVALALQEAVRAAVVGLPTRGKWTIQTIFPLRARGAVSVTTGRLLNVKGQPLDIGLVPDAIVDLARSGPAAQVTLGDPGSDLQLQRALEAVTRSVERHETSTPETNSRHATSADPDLAGAPPGPAQVTAVGRSGGSRPSH